MSINDGTARHATDIGAAIMAGAAWFLTAVQGATPVLAALTTLMAFMWWCWRYARGLWLAFKHWRKKRGSLNN